VLTDGRQLDNETFHTALITGDVYSHMTTFQLLLSLAVIITS